jgi:hypothetical protein
MLGPSLLERMRDENGCVTCQSPLLEDGGYQDDRFGGVRRRFSRVRPRLLAELDSNSFVPAALTPAQEAVKVLRRRKSLLPPRRKRSLQRRRLKEVG